MLKATIASSTREEEHFVSKDVESKIAMKALSAKKTDLGKEGT